MTDGRRNDPRNPVSLKPQIDAPSRRGIADRVRAVGRCSRPRMLAQHIRRGRSWTRYLQLCPLASLIVVVLLRWSSRGRDFVVIDTLEYKLSPSESKRMLDIIKKRIKQNSRYSKGSLRH